MGRGLASPAGFEPATRCLEGSRSGPLSYGDLLGRHLTHEQNVRSQNDGGLARGEPDATVRHHSRNGGRMRRIGSTLALALCLLGCGVDAPWGERVALLTGDGPFREKWRYEACYTSAAGGLLTVDPQYGTAIRDTHMRDPNDPGPASPVMWWPGFTAWRVGSEVEVRDPAGRVVAITGREYRLEGGYWSEDITPTASNQWAFSGPRAFFACGAVIPQ